MAFKYTVQKGDTLSEIAERFGVKLKDLEAANPQIKNPDLIFPGQHIHIP
jgi:spore coat assembly protein SafA